MSEQDDTTTEVDEATTDSPEEPEAPADKADEFDAERAKEKIAKANREAQNLRARLKELEPLAAKAKELEDANKSDNEKLIEDRDGHKSRADTAEAVAKKLNIALEAAPEGATIAQVRAVAKRLSGSTDEELAADAEELYELVGATAKPKVARKPAEKLRGGTDPDEPVEETDPRKLAAAIRGNR